MRLTGRGGGGVKSGTCGALELACPQLPASFLVVGHPLPSRACLCGGAWAQHGGVDRVVVWLGRGGFCRRNRIRLSNMTHALFQCSLCCCLRSALSLGLKKFGTTNTTKKRFQTAPRVAPAVCVLGVLQTLPGLPCVRLLLLLLLLVSVFFFFFRLRRLVRAVPRATAASLAEVLGSGVGTSSQHSNMCIMGGITRYIERGSAWCSALPCNQFQPYLLGLLFPST